MAHEDLSVDPVRNLTDPDRPVTLPEGFEDEASFLKFVRDLFNEDYDFDENNRDAALEDFKFVAGDQWDSDVLTKRGDKPTLTINRLPAFVGQVIGNRRLNSVDVKVRPDHGGTKDAARIREGLIRSVQKTSGAERVYQKTFENQVIGGIGNFQLVLDYADNDVFEQDIRIRAIPNPFSVIWDYESIDPTGADADHTFVEETMRREVFNARYPEARAGTFQHTENTNLAREIFAKGWITADVVRVVSYWQMRSETRVLALLNDGSVSDITELRGDDPQAAQILARIATDQQGEPIVRESERRFAEQYIVTATDVLEGPYRLPISRVPVFRAVGWEVNIGEERRRWGLVRFAQDPQRLHNFWRSVVAEKLMLTPKNNWVAADTAVEGREAEWRNSHRSDDPLLVYNADSGAIPTRVPPAQMEAALIQEAGLAAQDIKDVTNIHEASLGVQSNEVSGKAILARQRVGETGTIIYNENMDLAIEEAGKVMNELIPVVYDTPRTVRILPQEDLAEVELVRIQGIAGQEIGDEGEEVYDIASGKYMVTITTGPSYTTRRVEAAESMMNFVNAAPQMAAGVADLLVEAMDWPGAEKFAARFRKMLPDGTIPMDELSEEEQQARQAQAQQQQEILQLEKAIKMAEMQEKQADAQEAQARAQKAVAEAAKIASEVGVERMKAFIDANNKENDNLLNMARFAADQDEDIDERTTGEAAE